MSGQVRPFRKYSVPKLVEMVVKWRGETKVLVELVTELEFRQGKIARSMQVTLTEELKTADWDRNRKQHARWAIAWNDGGRLTTETGSRGR